MKRYDPKESFFQQWMEISDNTKVSPEVNKYVKGVYKETEQTYCVLNLHMVCSRYKEAPYKEKEPYYNLNHF